MNVRDALQKAVESVRTGRLGAARRICRRVLKVKPRQPDALHLLGVAALLDGEYDNAVNLIESAIRRRPDSASYYVNLGEALRSLGRTDQAIKNYETAIKLDPERAEAHCGLGSAYHAQHKFELAQAYFQRALEIQPNFAQAHYNKGCALCDEGKVDAGIAAYRQAVATDPSFRAAHFNLGNMLSMRGELVAAAAAYGAALESAPDYADAWCGFGDALRKLGRLESARQAYERATVLDGDLASAYIHLGTIAKLQGRTDTALTLLDRGIERKPDDALAHCEKAHVLLLQGKIDEAIARYRNAIDLDPRFAWGYMSLSSALAKVGRLTEARAASHKAVCLRRKLDRPFLGSEPIGRVVVLKGVEDGYFVLGRGDELVINVGMNNADAHFDRTRVKQSSFYVDDLAPGAECESLADCDVLFNAISDVDAMPRSHNIVKRIASLVPSTIINPPELIELCRRDTNYQLLHDADGIFVPKTIRVAYRIGDQGRILQLLDDAEINFPILVRRIGTHTGQTLERVDTEARLWSYLAEQNESSIYISQFVDFADRHQSYKKLRVYVIDGRLYPSQLFISDEWSVHVNERSRSLMLATEWMMTESRRFCEDYEAYLGDNGVRVLTSVHARLPLDYFGIDFTIMKDRRIFIFEANPVMRIPFTSTAELNAFPFRKRCVESIEKALQRLLEKRILEAKMEA